MKSSLSCFVVLAVSACGGGSDGGTQLITVDQGATIDLGSGTVIEIPAHAVAEDTEIAASLADVADFAVLDGSRGQAIVFDPPIALLASADATIDVEPAPTEGEWAIVYQFVDGAWVGLDVSTVTDAEGRVHTVIEALRPTAVKIILPDAS